MPHSESSDRQMPERRQFGFLHAHRFLLRTGLGIANAFAWIFVFQYFFSQTGMIKNALLGTILMYGFSQVATILLTPISAAHLRRGLRSPILWGVILASGAYVYLGATLEDIFNGNPAGWGIAIFAFLLGSYRALYWVPYQLRASVDGHDRARLPIVYEILIALMPAFAGITMATVPDAHLRLLFGSAIIVGASLVPLVALKDICEKFSWRYAETFQQLFRARHRRLLGASLGGGLQGMVLFLIWPISVFLIVGSDYKTLGAILSAAFLAILLLRYLYRKFARKVNVEQSVFVQIAFSVSGWAMRLFVGSPVGVVLADTYSHTSAPRSSHSIDTLVFEQSADQGSFVDELTALKEMGLAAGRVLACVTFALLLVWTTLPIAFASMLVLAGVASAVSIIMERKTDQLAL